MYYFYKHLCVKCTASYWLLLRWINFYTWKKAWYVKAFIAALRFECCGLHKNWMMQAQQHEIFMEFSSDFYTKFSGSFDGKSEQDPNEHWTHLFALESEIITFDMLFTIAKRISCKQKSHNFSSIINVCVTCYEWSFLTCLKIIKKLHNS